MELIIFALLIILALIQMLAFKGSLICGILIILFSAFILLQKYILKKPSGKIGKVIVGILSTSVVLLSLYGFSTEHIIASDFDDEIDNIVELIDDEKYEKAANAIDEFEENYGTCDECFELRALLYADQGNYEDANSQYQQIYDKTAYDAFLVEEKILLIKDDVSTLELNNFYQSAVDAFPDWEYMNIMCGYTFIQLQDYAKAEYYLDNAYALNSENPTTDYYLGMAYYYDNNIEGCLTYFDEAMELGVDEETESNIYLFLNEMGYFEQEEAE